MRYEIVLAPEAVDDLKRLKSAMRTTVRNALETHLRYEPNKTSRSRIKRATTWFACETAAVLVPAEPIVHAGPHVAVARGGE